MDSRLAGALIQHLQVGIVVQGPRSEILFCNPAAIELLGLDEAQLMGRTSFHPDWSAVHEDGTPFPGSEHPVPVCLATGKPVHDVVMGVYRPRSQDRVWLLVTAQPELDASGAVTCAIATFSDYSQRRAAELALRESQQRELTTSQKLATVVDALPLGILTCRADRTILTWNPAAERLFGWTAAEAIGANVAIIVPTESAGDQPLLRGHVARSEPLTGHETVRMHKDGTRLDVALTIAPLPGGTSSAVIYRDIAGAKRGEESLRRSEAKFRALIEQAPDAMLVHRDGVLVLVNDAVAKLLGWPGGETLIGHHIADMIAPEDRGRLALQISTDAGVLAPARWSLSCVKYDGTVVDVESAAQTIDFEGEAARLLIVRDMTKSRRAEHALEAAEAQFRSAFDYSSIGMALLSLEGRYLRVNEAMGRLFGYSTAEMLALDFRTLTHPEDLDTSNFHLERLLSGETKSFEMEKRYLHHDGSVVWIHLSSSLVRDAAGAPHYCVSQLHDISPRKRAEAALRESEERSTALLDALPDNIFRVSRDGTYRSVKLNGGAYFRGAPEALVGTRVQDNQAVPTDARETTARLIAECVDTRTPRTHEFLDLGGAGKDRELRLVPSGEDEAVVIVRDISERRKLDRMKRDFISTVSHELRTPLTSILGSLRLVTSGAAGVVPTHAHEFLEIAERNAERLGRLVNDILDSEKLEAGRMELHRRRLGLREAAEESLRANESYAALHQVRLALDDGTRGAPSFIDADPDRLAQILANLLSNACKFAEEGSEVRVGLALCDGRARVEVENHGPPIPPEFRGRIFQKFAQADMSNTRARGGSGLGLSITRAMVELHGGSIGFDCGEASTTFWFELPCAGADPRPQPALRS